MRKQSQRADSRLLLGRSAIVWALSFVALVLAALLGMAASTPEAPAALDPVADAVAKELLQGADGSDPAGINPPRSDEFVVSPRGVRLHLRTHWPADGRAPSAWVLSLHGYGAHGSRPTHAFVARALAAEEKSLGYVTLDWAGHGYSEGTRGLVESSSHLVDDALAALLALAGELPGERNFSVAPGPAAAIAGGLPFFVMGHR